MIRTAGFAAHPEIDTAEDRGRRETGFQGNSAEDASPEDIADEAARVRIAARAILPGILNTLAQDSAVTVRAAVALNPLFAQPANMRLVNDPDTRVRVLLAGKIARLLPGLTGPEHAAAQSHVHQMLVTLADDAAVMVRAAIADAITTMTEAPKDVVLKLARDPVIAVSDPVLRLSPLLTDADLLELLATPPNSGTAVSIACRAGLSAEVADEIACHAGSPAVCALLSNNSASIQEATLDALVGRAGDHPEWHEPLIRRPSLSARAIGSLTRFVASHLLDRLVNRSDLPPAIAEDLRGRLAETFTQVSPQISGSNVLENVYRFENTGKLNEGALMEAATGGDARAVAAILAGASRVSLATIDRAVAMRSAKGLVSLANRAGFSMRAGVVVQSVLGRITPGETLVPTIDGGYPLSTSEMDWQIELLGEPGR